MQGTWTDGQYKLNYLPLLNFWTATILLHAHLLVVYYKCVKYHKNPISRLGGVALTRYKDVRTDGRRTYGQGDSYILPNFVCAGIINSRVL